MQRGADIFALIAAFSIGWLLIEIVAAAIGERLRGALRNQARDGRQVPSHRYPPEDVQ